jgi:hypothetical protein
MGLEATGSEGPSTADRIPEHGTVYEAAFPNMLVGRPVSFEAPPAPLSLELTDLPRRRRDRS